MRDQLGVGSYPVTEQPDGAGIVLSLEAKDPEVRLTVCTLHCMFSSICCTCDIRGQCLEPVQQDYTGSVSSSSSIHFARSVPSIGDLSRPIDAKLRCDESPRFSHNTYSCPVGLQVLQVAKQILIQTLPAEVKILRQASDATWRSIALARAQSCSDVSCRNAV